MLLGEYEHTLDVKGRLAMPSKLRESLGNKFIITKGLDGCLFVYDLLSLLLFTWLLIYWHSQSKIRRRIIEILFSYSYGTW